MLHNKCFTPSGLNCCLDGYPISSQCFVKQNLIVGCDNAPMPETTVPCRLADRLADGMSAELSQCAGRKALSSDSPLCSFPFSPPCERDAGAFISYGHLDDGSSAQRRWEAEKEPRSQVTMELPHQLTSVLFHVGEEKTFLKTTVFRVSALGS